MNRLLKSLLITPLLSFPLLVMAAPPAMSAKALIKKLDSLPSDPNSGGPWVMYKGTPYAHIMGPVK